MTTVVGLFSSMAEAERVARDLNELGVSDSDINVVAGNEKNQHDAHISKTLAAGGSAASGAGSGAAIGGGLGLVAGLVALAIPGIGPIVAGGALATALTGLAVGAAAGGLIGAFAEMGVPQDEASIYQEGVRRGGVVVSARVNESMENEATLLMDRNGARDVNAEADVWSAAGWAGPTMGGMVYDPAIQPLGYSPALGVPDMKRTSQRRSRSYPESRSSGVSSGTSEDTNATPKHQATSPLDLSAIPADSGSEHFPHRTGPHKLSSDPAWIFGNRWASDPNYAGKNWSDVESGLRSSWESVHAGPWDSNSDRVRRGYEKREDEAEDPLASLDLSSRSGQRGY